MTSGSIGCAYPGCGQAARTRGLCSTHYSRLLAQVRKGATTWAALEAEGKCRPPDPEARQRWAGGRHVEDLSTREAVP